nr:MAG TPA: hypothetical protein [Caudoviricetes sp.]
MYERRKPCGARAGELHGQGSLVHSGALSL